MKRLPTIRQTVIAPPSRITQARVKKTVREANTRSLSMLASATVIAFVSGVITAYQLPLNEEKPYAAMRRWPCACSRSSGCSRTRVPSATA